MPQNDIVILPTYFTFRKCKTFLLLLQQNVPMLEIPLSTVKKIFFEFRFMLIVWEFNLPEMFSMTIY